MTIDEFIRDRNPGWKVEMPGVNLVIARKESDATPHLWVILQRGDVQVKRRIEPQELIPPDDYRRLMEEIRAAYNDLGIAEDEDAAELERGG